jgi:hemolysin activation/secretion protein
VSLGVDYKHFEEDVVVGEETFSTPIQYWPFTASYSAAWMGDKRFTELNTSFNFHARGMGSDSFEFDAKRYNATGAYLYLRGDLSHTQDLPGGFQLYGKVQGQVSTDPLINSEQFAGGGLATARGYLESAALGDNTIFGTLEFRSPNFLGAFKSADDADSAEPAHEWRVYAFLEGGRLTINDPLPEQQEAYKLASYGVGSFMRLFGHLNGSIDASIPLEPVGETLADDLFVSFRVWAEF